MKEMRQFRFALHSANQRLVDEWVKAGIRDARARSFTPIEDEKTKVGESSSSSSSSSAAPSKVAIKIFDQPVGPCKLVKPGKAAKDPESAVKKAEDAKAGLMKLFGKKVLVK